jgi:hypothetical protein
VIEQSGARTTEMVECFRHEGEECPCCDGNGYRPRGRWEGCHEPSGHPSEGGKTLIGLTNRSGFDQPMYC